MYLRAEISKSAIFGIVFPIGENYNIDKVEFMEGL